VTTSVSECHVNVRGGGEGKRRILIGQSVPPTPFGMAFGRLKLSPRYSVPRALASLEYRSPSLLEPVLESINHFTGPATADGQLLQPLSY
jgi:hypothetical protein